MDMMAKIENVVADIWIESEITGEILGGTKQFDDNSDVIVTLSDGARYVATFFTFQNLNNLTKKNAATGECLNGRYFWAGNMIIVNLIDRKEITEIINHLLKYDEFLQVFSKLK